VHLLVLFTRNLLRCTVIRSQNKKNKRTCSQAGRITLTRGLKQYAHAFSNVCCKPINLKVSAWDFPYVDRGTAHTCLTYIRRASVANMTKCTYLIINNAAIVWQPVRLLQCTLYAYPHVLHNASSTYTHTHTYIETSQESNAAA